MSDTSENDENTAVKRKKGVINAHLYKRNIIKKGRLTGKSYTNSVVKLIPDKLVATSCSCQINCLAQLQQQEKENNLQYFNSLKSKDEQDLFLQGLLECSESRRRKEINNKRPKLISTKYYILSGTRRILVCKTGFLLVYGISKKGLSGF